MILILIFSGLIILGIIFSKLWNVNDYGDYLGCLSFVIGSACLSVSIVLIAVNHINAPKVIQENKLKYESLCKRCEIIKSEYEDISKSDLINDIAEWNMEVYDTKYRTSNPWTSWFNPPKIADNLDYIYLDTFESIIESEDK